MAHSMTAFARASAQTGWGEITCELRSVNHRYLEIHPRLSEEIRYLEPKVRDSISAALNRGRVDCSIRFQAQEGESGDIEIDQKTLEQLVKAGARITAASSDIEPLRVADVMRWPGVVRALEVDVDSIGVTAIECLNTAVADLVATRAREGERLRETLVSRVKAATDLVDQVTAGLPEWSQAFRERLEQRLGHVKEEMDPIRLEQEIVIHVQKADVAEEVDRLQVHLQEVGAVLSRTQPIGRRLDFLMQELNREANTLGAKSVDARLTQASVELKVLIEQMREQVQNIE